MGTYIYSLRCTGSGCYDVRVIQEHRSKKYPNIISSETIYTYRCTCMPIIDDYKSDDIKRQRQGEKQLIRLAKWWGHKEKIKYDS